MGSQVLAANGPRFSISSLCAWHLSWKQLWLCVNACFSFFFSSGGLNTALSCPQDVLKSRLQVQVASGPGGYLGPLATLRLLVASPLASPLGVRALYAGWLPLACRDVPGYALLYSAFVHGRAAPSLAAVPTWGLGGASGVAFYLATLPVDRVKTVMMTQSLERPAFASPRAALAEIVAKDGVAGLYRGCAPTLVRTFVGQAAALTVYEWARAAA